MSDDMTDADYAQEEAATRYTESVLSQCHYKLVPEELTELLADNDDFLNLLIPENLPKPLSDYLKEKQTEFLEGIIYLIVTQRRNKDVRYLMDEIESAIDTMRVNEDESEQLRKGRAYREREKWTDKIP